MTSLADCERLVNELLLAVKAARLATRNETRDNADALMRQFQALSHAVARSQDIRSAVSDRRAITAARLHATGSITYPMMAAAVEVSEPLIQALVYKGRKLLAEQPAPVQIGNGDGDYEAVRQVVGYVTVSQEVLDDAGLGPNGSHLR